METRLKLNYDQEVQFTLGRIFAQQVVMNNPLKAFFFSCYVHLAVLIFLQNSLRVLIFCEAKNILIICLFSLVQSQTFLGLQRKKASLAFLQSLAFHTHHSSRSRQRKYG